MDFLLEVGCEEIPARFVLPALTALEQGFSESLKSARLSGEAPARIRTLGTPRRLALMALGLPASQPDLEEEILGPRVEAAYTKDGQPTQACLGFLKSRQAQLSELKTIESPKGPVVALRRRIAGKPTAEVLPELLAGLLQRLPFPKTMRWGEGEVAFCRPVHWLVALLDGKVLPLAFAGVNAGGSSRGHRFTSPGEIPLRGPDDYVAALRGRDVLVEPQERQKLLVAEARRLAEEAGGRLVPDPGLEEEVTFLTECPVPLLGRFDERFLLLPRQVLVAAMRNHQRYFAVERPDGSLLPAFVAVGNTRVKDPAVVRHGNERVLAARLSDARFFFEVDQKIPPTERVPRLQEVIFQADLGSYYEKAVRVANLAMWLAYKGGLGAWEKMNRVIEVLTIRTDEMRDAREWLSWRVGRAALLCKTDLLTGLVGEFPELQGEMGGVYAGLAGEDEDVARAIAEHYHPRFASDSLPKSDEGSLLAMADRLDTLAGCFGIGLRPTGGADPYALRRACLGVIGIVLGRRYRVGLRAMLQQATSGVRDKIEAVQLRKAQAKARKAAARKGQEPPPLPERAAPFEEQLLSDLVTFFSGRLRQRFAEQAPADVVEAVLSAGIDDLVAAELRVEALARFARQPAFENLAVAVKRVANIIKDFKGGELDAALFSQPEEQELHQVYQAVAPLFQEHVENDRFAEAMELLGSRLRAPVDRFFEKVLVNDPKDPPRQANRKALLQRLAGLFGRIADFTKLQTREVQGEGRA